MNFKANKTEGMIQSISTAIALFIVLASCTPKQKQGETPIVPNSDSTISVANPDPAHNSQNSLDWEGTYKGVLPCADCEGIETEITIKRDYSYTLTTKYLGKAGKQLETSGTYVWDAAGSNITLSGIKNAPATYKVGENTLIQLDMQGNVITGDLADKYRLAKVNGNTTGEQTKNVPITETKWILVELMGRPIDKNSKYFVQLHAADNRVSASGGCNGIGGNYEITENNRIKFSGLLSTMMACPDMSVEDGLKAVLGRTDSYYLNGNNFQLVKSKMAPLAKFEAE